MELHYFSKVSLLSYIVGNFLPDVTGRITELQKMLDDDNIASNQKGNIKVVIKMYEKGVLLKQIGELLFVRDGEVCERFPDA